MKALLLRLYFLFRLPVLLALRCAGMGKRRDDIRRILVIRLDRLGDFVLFLPVIDGLRRAFPGARIDALVAPCLESLARCVPEIDTVLVDRSFAASVAALSRQGYDLAVDGLHDYGLRSALLAFFSRAGERIGFAAGFRELLFTRSARMMPGQHVVEDNLGLLALLGIAPVQKDPVFFTPVLPGTRNVVIVHPGAHYPSQRWPKGYFIDAATAVARGSGARIVVIGSAAERGLVQEVACGIAGAQALCVPLGELPGTMAGSRLFIGNNSGPLHLAAALGLPTVSVMGPTDPVLFSPRGAGNVVFRGNRSCSPCAKAVCRGHECLREILPGAVTEAALRLLERARG